MAATAIDISDLHLDFGGESLLQGVSLSVPQGAKYTLTGPSGTGKSTILKIIMGFIVPDKGEIRILGEVLDPVSVWRLRSKICCVAQEPEPGEGTVEDILRRPFGYSGNRHLEYRPEYVRGMLKRLNLPTGIIHKEISSLSGGEKQRVAMVSALILERPIYLLDEPASALDHENKELLMKMLGEIRDTTILMVAHDLKEHPFSDRVLTLKSGVLETAHVNR